MKSSLLILFSFLFLSLNAQEYDKRVYSATRTSSPPLVDGSLNDEAWFSGEWSGSFWQYSPVEGGPASQETDFMLLYDDDNIYIAIRCHDTAPDSIVSLMNRRDYGDGDNVSVIIDSYFDQRTAFGFTLTSAGVKNDFIWTDDGMNHDSSWDPIWYAKTMINDRGWVAEIRIPLTELRFSDKKEQTWGFEIYRYIYRLNETLLWQPMARNASGRVHTAGLLTGLTDISPRPVFDITPYGVAKYQSYEGESGNPWYKGRDLKGNLGLDAKIGVTSNMTLSLSVNPDFGQVEADPSVVNLSAFETYYTEKRPFFVEGKNITDYNLGIGSGTQGNDNMFYSRRIGRSPGLRHTPAEGEFAFTPSFTPIIGSAKLTGKSSDGLSIGMIEAVTARVNTRIRDPINNRTYLRTAEPLTNYTVGRVQKDFRGGETIIGGILTSTIRLLDTDTENSLHKTATTGGIDFTRYFGGMNYIFQVRTAFSNVTGTKEMIARTQSSVIHNYTRPDNDYARYDPERTSLNGHAGNLMAGKIGGNWQFLYLSSWKSPGFDINDAGYMQMADHYTGVGVINYNIFKPFSIYKGMSFGTNLIHIFDFGGNLNSASIVQSWTSEYRNLWRTTLDWQLIAAQNDNLFLRGGPSMKLPGQFTVVGKVESDGRKKLSGEAQIKYYNTFQGRQTSYILYLQLRYKPTNSIVLSIVPIWYQRLDKLQYVTTRPLTSDTKEQRYIFGTIDQKELSISFRADYTITPDLSIQYWGQPFFGAGRYFDFKRITNPQADKLDNRYQSFDSGRLSYNIGQKLYSVDEDLDSYPDYLFWNPDFSISEFLHNLVIRWEFRPGSTAYLVWSQARNHYSSDGLYNFRRQSDDLYHHSRGENVFLLKFSYRFGLH